MICRSIRVGDFRNINEAKIEFSPGVNLLRGDNAQGKTNLLEAIYYMAEKEALILDPCYTGKAFAGLLQMVKDGKIAQGENVVFLHTGGSPGISTPFHRIEMEHERDKYIHIV